MKGKLIVIEGTDASGKKTQSQLLHRALSLVYDSALVSFPMYGRYSATLVEAYLGGKFGSDPEKVNPYAASILYSVDRFASYKDRTDCDTWGECYDRGGIVVADRYTTANVVHQMEKLMRLGQDPRAYIDWLYNLEYNIMDIPRPDMVIYLHMPRSAADKLLTQRAVADTSHKADIHEKDTAYLDRCRQAGLVAAKLDNWEVISCADEHDDPRSISDIHDQLLQLVQTRVINKEEVK